MISAQYKEIDNGSGSGFTVKPDFIGMFIMFPERHSVFLGRGVQNRLAYQKADEQGICVKNRALPSLLLTLNREPYNLSRLHVYS